MLSWSSSAWLAVFIRGSPTHDSDDIPESKSKVALNIYTYALRLKNEEVSSAHVLIYFYLAFLSHKIVILTTSIDKINGDDFNIKTILGKFSKLVEIGRPQKMVFYTKPDRLNVLMN